MYISINHKLICRYKFIYKNARHNMQRAFYLLLITFIHKLVNT